MASLNMDEKRGPRGVALVAFAAIALALLAAQWQVQKPSESGEKTGKRRPLGAPDTLVTFGEFARLTGVKETSPVEQSRRSLLFASNLAQVGQHNLHALTLDATREPVYYIGQNPAGAYLTRAEQMSLLIGGEQAAMREMLAAGHERAVSGGPGLEKKGGLGLGRWFKRVTDSHYLDIPNFPLDQQPNPERVTHIDVDLRDCTDVIKNQGTCGACYAFSFVSLAEWHLCRLQDGKISDLSEQYIVDCGHKTKLGGCREGRISNVRSFSQYFGMKLEEHQKYEAKERGCSNSMTSKNILPVKIVDWKKVKIDREVFERTLEDQPIVLEVRLPADFGSYSRGVHPANNCKEEYGHGMLLVGHGRQDGVPYWLVRNSMGANWGENGYLRVSRDMKDMQKCFRTGFVGKFKFAHVDEAKYTELYDSFEYDPPVAPEIDQSGDGKLLNWLHDQVAPL